MKFVDVFEMAYKNTKRKYVYDARRTVQGNPQYGEEVF